MNNADGKTNEATHNTEELQLKNTDKTKQRRLTDKHEQRYKVTDVTKNMNTQI